jgi:Kef-type K+ transport system membrane component KefB/predicted lipoprotein with Yx(FWY)xxD motif
MEGLHFTNLLGVSAIAFIAPLALGLAPRIMLPAVVLELVAGIVVGPDGLGWVQIDEPVRILSLMGLAMLLFLAGLEVEFDRLRGRVLRLSLAGFAASFTVGLAVGLGLYAVDLVKSPVFVAIVLSATSLGVVIPVLKDAGLAGSPFGQLVIAAASIADVATIVLLSLLFSGKSGGTGAKLVLLGGLALLAAVVVIGVVFAGRSMRLGSALVRLQDTTAQIRVRAAMLLLVGFVAIAEQLGLEVILGAFVAGALVSLLDRDPEGTHPLFRTKLEGLGYGLLVPAFFVTSGLRFDLDALTASASTLARVPVFLVALLAVRGLPALLYRGYLGDGRKTVVAGLLQATSLPFIVAATQIGLALELLTPANAAALVAAGLLSLLLFPLASLIVLQARRNAPALGVATALGAILLLGYGSAGSNDASAQASPSASASKGRVTTLKLGQTRFGRILVDGRGRTLYLFTREASKRSRCYGACARAWPPFYAGSRTLARSGLDRRLLGTTRRRGGRRQVTYRGHPLYFYVGETRAGQVLCQDVFEFGGRWLIVNRSGSAIR